MTHPTTEPFIAVKELSKSFAGNTVLQGVSFSIHPGEFHGLIGENGAGKSTLINLLTGVFNPDTGTITVCDRTFKGLSPAEASHVGVHVVHQELSLSPHLTITQNIFLGRELHRGIGTLRMKEMRAITRQLLDDVELSHLRPDMKVHQLSLSEQQLVEFIKATYEKPKLLILDEATSALDSHQVAIMFNSLRKMRENGMAIIFVSHRLQEMFDICDSVTVLKDGQQVVTRPMSGLDEDQLVTLMTGRTFVDMYPEKLDLDDVKNQPEVLTVADLKTPHLDHISFSLHLGEILGLGGLQGQGQQELLGTLFGLYPVRHGTITLEGKSVSVKGPKHAMNLGLAYLPEDRKTEGLFLSHSIRFNLSFASLDKLSRFGTVQKRKEQNSVFTGMKKLAVKALSMEQRVSALSGGNQQKVVLAKWLERNPRILLLNEPTRGIDVGTKTEIYDLLRQLTNQGISIILLSSSALELIGLCDRVVVLYEHRINAVIVGEDLTEENLVRASVL